MRAALGRHHGCLIALWIGRGDDQHLSHTDQARILDAIAFNKAYTKFKDEATEERLKEFFGALVEIETDHLDLHAEHLG